MKRRKEKTRIAAKKKKKRRKKKKDQSIVLTVRIVPARHSDRSSQMSGFRRVSFWT